MRAAQSQKVGALAAHRRYQKMLERWTLAASRRGVQVPKWVPRELIVEFCDCALAHGEERAASHIRKRKKEMSS